jgi:hypothetical protein
MGYFSSNNAAPYADDFDGFWLDSSANTISVKVCRNGVYRQDLSIQKWTGYADLGAYQDPAQWSKFTVIRWDFVWLGGAALRLWIKIGDAFVLAHHYNFAGTDIDTMIARPTKTLRAEVRSLAGVSGTMRYICGQIATEGPRFGATRSVNSGSTVINANAAGTVYPILSIRRNSAFRHVPISVDAVNLVLNTASRGMLSLQINPTLSAPLTYASVANSAAQSAIGNGTITVTTPGQIVDSMPMGQNSPGPVLQQLATNMLSFIGGTIADVSDEYVVCWSPSAATTSVLASLDFTEY